MARPKVFLDSSMLIAAVLSPSGGSFYILHQWHDRFEFQINKFVFNEVNEVFSEKFPSKQKLQSRFLLLLGLSQIIILDNPPKQKVHSAAKIIEKEDAPILASALDQSSYLITLDNDFFNEKVRKLSRQHTLHILKPKDFILKYRSLS